jgi:alpha-tubulin suppressor-like RCC1 family protein
VLLLLLLLTLLTCGVDHVVTADGTVYHCGENDKGQAGSGSSSTNHHGPVPVPLGRSGFKQVACGESHSVALHTDGSVYSWGYNDHGQAGSAMRPKARPQQVSLPGPAVSISASMLNSYALVC